MKKIVILLLAFVFVIDCTQAQDKLYICKDGVVVVERYISQIDSITFTPPTTYLVEKLSENRNSMFTLIGNQYCVYGSVSSRDDDAGFPTVCLSQDLNGPDMVSDDSNYNWFSVSSLYNDRNDTYANPYMRWAVFYNQLKLANDLLIAIPDDRGDLTLKAYKAQARAVRAFDYLSLVPYFQFKYKGNEDEPSVPIITENTTDPSNNPRATQREVFALIMSDLDAAINDLSGYVRTSKGEIDLQVAYGLRARANLYMENWAAAAADADKAMAGYTPYSKEQVSSPTFISANDQNWMWAIILFPTNIPDAYPSWPSVLGSFSGDSYSAAVGCYKSVNVLLFNKIPVTDVRKGWWVDENLHSANLAGVTWGGATGDAVASLSITDVKLPFIPYTNVKFGQYGGIGNNVNAGDWCIMRVEEMILIKAEATAMAGDLNAGKTILKDFVSTYRDPSYVTSTAATATAFQDEIWLQRRIELWGEGFSMSDIMRLGKNIVRFKSGITSNFPDRFKFNIGSNDKYLLLRIPKKVTDVNLGIPLSANNNEGTQPVSGDGAELKDGVTD
ncbi:MAG: RagB/SusD family nutrient uptake outer membrane protein [Paludibacter sp.]